MSADENNLPGQWTWTIFDQCTHVSDACVSGEGSGAVRVEQQAKCREAELYGEVLESDASLGGPYFVHVKKVHATFLASVSTFLFSERI
jgi:hypothetical protein